jgi:hypothetical protein
MSITGFKPVISAIGREQTYALDLTANGIGNPRYLRTGYENLSPLEPLKPSVIRLKQIYRDYCLILWAAEHDLNLALFHKQ